MDMSKVFLKDSENRPSGAVFLSGSGTNAEKILEDMQENGSRLHWTPKVLVTDRPKTSRAREIAARFGLPLIEHGIAAFYRAHGMEHVTLANEEGQRIRELWTDELRRKLEPYAVDFGILAGFVPLTNLAASLPCLNVHPGDLTYLKNGRRWLVGLHSLPVERAILEGQTSLRSSVILVRPYSASAKDDVDNGPLLGISAPMKLDLQGHSLTELQEIFRQRQGNGVPHDLLSDLASHNQELLKHAGDHVVYPAAIDDFAQGCFAEDDNGGLLFRENRHAAFQPICTVEYSAGGTKKILSR